MAQLKKELESVYCELKNAKDNLIVVSNRADSCNEKPVFLEEGNGFSKEASRQRQGGLVSNRYVTLRQNPTNLTRSNSVKQPLSSRTLPEDTSRELQRSRPDLTKANEEHDLMQRYPTV